MTPKVTPLSAAFVAALSTLPQVAEARSALLGTLDAVQLAEHPDLSLVQGTTPLILGTRMHFGALALYANFPKEQDVPPGSHEPPVQEDGSQANTSNQYQPPILKPDNLDVHRSASAIIANAFVDVRSNQSEQFTWGNSLMGAAMVPSVIPQLAQAGFGFEKVSTPSSPTNFKFGINAGAMADIIAAPTFTPVNRFSLGYSSGGFDVQVGRIPFTMGVSSDFFYNNANITPDDQQLTLPFLTDGIVVTGRLSENHSVYGGIVNGQQVTGVQVFSPALITGYRYQDETGFKIEGDVFVTKNVAPPHTPANQAAVTDVKLTVPLGDRHELKLLFDLGVMGAESEMRPWQVAGLFIKGGILDNWDHGFRAEWVHDPGHVVSNHVPEGQTSHGNVAYAHTFSLFKNLLLRLEYRGNFTFADKFTHPSLQHQLTAAVVARWENPLRKWLR